MNADSPPASPVANPPGGSALRRWPVRLAIGLVVLLVLYTLAGFLLTPWLAQRYLPPLVAERLGVELTLGQLRFNPFSLRAETHEVTVSLPDGERLMTAKRLSADLAWSGLFTRRWTLAAVELDRPQIELVREADGSFALPKPADAETVEDPAARERTPPAMLLRQLALNQGRVTVRSRDGEYVPVVVDHITLEASDIATDADAPPGSYRLAAGLPDGGALTAEGRLTAAARSSEGSITITNAELSGWWPLAARELALAPPQGRLSAKGSYRTGLTANGFDLVLDDLSLAVEELHLAQPDSKTPMLALQHATTTGGRFALGERQLSLPGLHLALGELGLQMDATGQLDWASLRREADRPPAPDSLPWHIELPDARVEALTVHYRELSNERRRLDVASADATGTLLIATGGEGVRLENLNATLQDPRFSAGDATPLAVERIAVEEGSLDTARRSLRAAGLALSGSRIELAIAPDGTLEIPGGLLPRAAPEGKPAEDANQPWSYDIRRVSAEGIELHLHDRRVTTPVQLQATGSAQLSNVASGVETPVGIEARLDLASGGSLHLQGEAAQDAGSVQARLRLDGVDLSPARALVEYHTTLRLVSGRIGGELQLHFARDAQPKLEVEGNARLDAIRFDVAETGDPLFSARSVTTSGALQLAPNQLVLSSVVLNHPTAVLKVDAERRLNLAEVVRQRKEADAPRKDGAPFALRMERIELREATIDFSDESLILPFSTQITQLNGALRSVDNAPDSEAVIDARGAIKPHGEARAEGRLRPFAPGELTDVTVNFDNVEMSELSPYTATFAGRSIARGRLWLAVDYRVFDQRLDGLNAVTLEDFELGERVDSPGSMDLPLELAIALLRDADGRVHLEVPVRGEVGDADFGYGALVRDAIGNVLRRAVTAPFRFLARLVGGGDDEDDSLQAIGFEAGSDQIAPPQAEKLQRLAEALTQRPQLRLQLRGTYFTEADEKALRTQALRNEIADGAGTAPETGPVPQLDFSNDAVRSAVAGRYQDLTGPNALDEFRSEFARGPEAGNEAALHRALFERLLQSQPLAEGALEDLARKRSEAVQFFLSGRDVAEARLEIQPAASASSDKGAGVELTVAAD